MSPLVSRIHAIIEGAQPGAYVVRVQEPSGRNTTLGVEVDTDDGISLDACIALNRLLREQLEAEALMPDTWGLEVGSPGLGQPLVLQRQYRRHLGRLLQVTLADGTVQEGTLLELHDQAPEPQLVLKQRTVNPNTHRVSHQQITIPLAQVTLARVEVQFK